MKIVYVLNNMTIKGGLERIITFKMNYLSERNYDIYFVTASQGDHPLSFKLSSRVKHIDLNVPFHHIYKYKLLFSIYKRIQLNYLFKKRFINAIKEIDPDIMIATTNFLPDIVCTINCRAKKIIESHYDSSLIASINKNDSVFKRTYKNIRAKLIVNKIRNRCDILVTLTEGDLRQWSMITHKTVISNPISFIPKKSSPLSNKIVISVGRLEAQKGFDMLISAWKIVSDKHKDWILNIYGDGSLRDELEKQIQNLHLSSSCRLHPAVEEISKKYLESSIYVMSSLYEGFPLVLMEAMTYGIPCVSFDCPFGPSEIINDKIDGVLVDPNNIEKMADAINLYIENAEERKEAGMRARMNVSRFSSDTVMNKWIELFKSFN
jgi:glycosyltransferase involved in cell wall biosynthesis